MANFGPKPWVNPLQKSQFLDFLNFLFLKPRRTFYRSRIKMLKKRKMEKWPVLEKNHG